VPNGTSGAIEKKIRDRQVIAKRREKPEIKKNFLKV